MVVVQELFAECHWKVEDKQGRVHGPMPRGGTIVEHELRMLVEIQ